MALTPACRLGEDDLARLRVKAASGQPLTSSEASLLMMHIDWQSDEIERVSEMRDSVRDALDATLGRNIVRAFEA